MEPAPLRTLAEAERAHIRLVLDATRWNKKAAARVLRISRGTLYRKIAGYRLRRGRMNVVELELTSSQLMALKDLILDYIGTPRHLEVFIDVVRDTQTTPEELLALVCEQDPL